MQAIYDATLICCLPNIDEPYNTKYLFRLSDNNQLVLPTMEVNSDSSSLEEIQKFLELSFDIEIQWIKHLIRFLFIADEPTRVICDKREISAVYGIMMELSNINPKVGNWYNMNDIFIKPKDEFGLDHFHIFQKGMPMV